MFAARDQENLVHAHQQAAASKPLNQGVRQLGPKTPGNKAPKTPFKKPINDENGPAAFGGGKTGAKANGKGNENFLMTAKKGGLGDKDAFKTPVGPRNRAPLGAKTTNAKTKAYHIPPPSVEDVPDKSPQKSASARKSRPRVSHAEMTKLEIHGDLDELGEREIEYMPPPPKPLPDYPDDIHESNLTPFPNGEGLTAAILRSAYTAPDWEGLSYDDRQEIKRKEEEEKRDKMYMAQMEMDIEISAAACICEPECPGGKCSFTLEATKKAEAKYQKKLEEIYPEQKPKAAQTSTANASSNKPTAPKPVSSRGPGTLTSRSAATALSQAGNPKIPEPISKSSIPPTTKSRLPFSNISSRKQPPPPTNPSAMRHTAATLASKTTIGRSAGRSVSANLRKPSAPSSNAKAAPEAPDTDLPPALYITRYGEPKLGSEMWVKCQDAGCFDEDQEDDLGFGAAPFRDFLDEEAERDFVLQFD